MVKHIVSLLLIAAFANSAGAQDSPGTRKNKLVVASCQFPVSQSISENYNWIKEQIIESKLKKADIVHFSECALSGYPGVDFQTMEGFNWDELDEKTDSILSLAKQLKIWIILGSIHPMNDGNKPYNCLYVINSEGEIADRYDKRFCTNGDLKHFSSGDQFVNFKLNGVKCGLLICYDIRFPELYREYKKLQTDLIFQSFHNARQKKGSIHPIIMPITSQARAATNFFYMSITNSSATESWPCHFITPDGLIQNKLTTNVDGVLISTIDLSVDYYDASRKHRGRAMEGVLNSGGAIQESHSNQR
jgi:predicted amidohydrolase